jgi:hypothetical protein
MKRKSIRIIFCSVILFFLIAIPHSQAAEWIYSGSNNSGHLYYEKKSIERNGDIVRVRSMAILNDDGKIELHSALKKIGRAPRQSDILSHTIALEEYDCANQRLRLSSMTIYNEKGSAIHSLIVKNAEWDDIVPETNGAILGKIVCSDSK